MNTPTPHDSPPPPPPLWQIVAARDYEVPADSQPATLQRRWRSLGRLLLGTDDADPAQAEADLRALPQVRLANLAPPIDWAPAARALGAQESLDAEAHAPVRLFIGQPYCDHPAILAHWAHARGAVVLAPPDTDQILGADRRWLDDLAPGNGRPWVLPELERCFLRHANGLDLVRDFLARALSGTLGPGMIGCDSWALAFIERISPLPGTATLTLQAFDGLALTRYLMRPDRGHVRFLSARSGEPLMPEDAGGSDGNDRHAAETACPELRQLAAHCRGNPGLAWHYWRQRLRTAPEREQQAQAGEARHDTPQRADGERLAAADEVVWVAPGIETPTLPAESGEDVAFLLHALLLHRGLEGDVLGALLPIPPGRLHSHLLRLQALELLSRAGARWQVAPLAYPAVREFLRSRSYLTDSF
ncbi:hypothetical protein [Thauera sp. WH-1]|uniref:hypothetical protein n=1 Tax=Thauera sp. WH-1 TaxID=3398230 RepID=UPI0039FDAC4A